MQRVRIIHWQPAKAQGPPDAAPKNGGIRPSSRDPVDRSRAVSPAAGLIDAVRAAGFHPEYDGEMNGPAISRAIRASPPDAVLIDLSRLPSHGREIGIWLRGTKLTRTIPLVFVNGQPDKVAKVRQDLPDAAYATDANLAVVLKSACRAPTRDPVVPAQMMDRYKEKSTARKLGIAADSTVAVMNAPRGYASALKPLPENVELLEDPSAIQPVTLWFISDPETLLTALPRMRAIAARTKLWIVWRKGQRGGISQNAIREAAIDAGLVDYKICSLDPQWSGILFARKKS